MSFVSTMKASRDILWTVGVCVLYVATAKLGLEYAVIGNTVTLLWPPSGIALAATLIGGYRVWPGVALGALLANAGTGIPIITLLIITLGNTLEPLFGSKLLRRLNNFTNSLDKVSDVLALILFAAVVSTTVSASLGTLGLFIGGEIAAADVGPAWLAWWLGDGMGVLIISPVLLIGAGEVRRYRSMFSFPKTLEALTLFVAMTMIGQAIFGSQQLASIGHYPVSLSLFPFVIWSALRFGTFAAAGVTLIASLLAVHGTAQGTGPFAVGSAWGSMIRWCLFADIMAITGLLLGAIGSERKKALTALRNSNQELEQARKAAEATLVNLSEYALRQLGRELHDDLGQVLTGAAMLANTIARKMGHERPKEAAMARKLTQLLNEAVAKTRLISHGLSPVDLDEGGLPAMLNSLAQHIKGTQGIDVFLDEDCPLLPLGKETALHVFRIIQEATTNVARHSGATALWITSHCRNNTLIVSVLDNGVGMTEDTRQGIDKGIGIVNMHARAHLIGADLDIQRREQGGTALVLSMPLPMEKIEHAHVEQP